MAASHTADPTQAGAHRTLLTCCTVSSTARSTSASVVKRPRPKRIEVWACGGGVVQGGSEVGAEVYGRARAGGHGR